MQAAPASPSGELRAGVVGLGAWGVEHLRAWDSIPGVRVVAICDLDGELVDRLASTFGIHRRYTDAARMAADGGLDVVSIAGGEHDRLGTAVPFFRAGVHALVEKPLALDVSTAEELVAQAREASVILMTGHVLRFDPRFAALKHRIEDGSVGEVRSVYARRLNLMSAHEKYSRAHPALMAQIHDIDLACWYFADQPRAVWARELVEPGGPQPPRVLWTVLEFPKGIAVLEHAWVLPDTGGVWLESETEVIGTGGVARIRTPSDGLVLLSAAGHEAFDPAVAAVCDGLPAVALKQQLSYLARCIQRQEEPTRLSLEDALAALRVAFRVVDSVKSGGPQSIQTPRSGMTNFP
jgi:UDP-N-acetylglucosamine 3-dehydrogenase